MIKFDINTRQNKIPRKEIEKIISKKRIQNKQRAIKRMKVIIEIKIKWRATFNFGGITFSEGKREKMRGEKKNPITA